MNYLLSLELEPFTTFLYFWVSLSVLSFITLCVIKELPISSRIENEKLSCLGRIDKRLGWIIMEIPILIVVLYFFIMGKNPINASVVIVAAFLIHYVNRALIFPWRIKVKGKTMPVLSMIASLIFYVINGYLVGHYFGDLRVYPIEWLYDPRFIIGMSLFVSGLYINISSDNILINLRKPGETGYKIPHSKAFKWVSCPNYMGESLEWIGFAIMSWSLLGAVYAAWVALPLIAQAISAHAWYQETFADYPKDRKAIIPFIL